MVACVNKKATSTLQIKSIHSPVEPLNCCTGLFFYIENDERTLAAARRRMNKSGYLGVLNTKACVWLADSVRNPPSRFYKKILKKN